ncbi:MAG: hypothetical protein ACP5I8_16320 [Phycisphaerae bacterium]
MVRREASSDLPVAALRAMREPKPPVVTIVDKPAATGRGNFSGRG